MGRSLRRREARLLQGRAALLLPRLVGRRTDADWDRQSRQMECAAEVLSIHSRAGGPLRQQLDDGEIRCAESEVSATNPNFKKLYDSLTSFSNNGYQWFQVAEVGYDNFMARHSQS